MITHEFRDLVSLSLPGGHHEVVFGDGEDERHDGIAAHAAR